MEVSNLAWCLQLILVGLCSAIDLNDDLRLLAEMLPGVYSNDGKGGRQVPRRFERPLVPDQTPAEALTTIPLRASYRPVDVSFLTECFNVYVEQTVTGKTRPHRRWLYSFSKDDSTRSIKLRVFEFKDTSIVDKISKNPKTLKYLTEDDVTTMSNCDMYWRRLGDTFVGTTSRQCTAIVDHKQVRISVMTTLSSTSLQIDEGWYNANDGSKVIELDGPIFLTKVDRIKDNPYLNSGEKSTNEEKKPSKSQLQRDSRKMQSSALPNRIPEGKISRQERYRSSMRGHNSNAPRFQANNKDAIYSNVIEQAGFTQNGGAKRGSDYGFSAQAGSANNKVVQTNKEKTMWVLQTYEGVINALESGHKVYFTAKTKKCRHVGAKKREQSIIGDYVDTFEIQKDFTDKQPNKYLQFSLRRTMHTKKGFQDVVKQVTTHRNGTIHIMTVYLSEEGRIVKNYFSECELFDQDTRKGDVRYFLDPYRDVSEITRTKSLLSALYNGNMVRVTSELDKCSGGQSDHVIIGGELRGYDMGRNGKTVDFNLKTTKLVQNNGDISVEDHFIIFKFPKRGEVTLIKHRKHVTSLIRNVSIVNGYQRYKCDVDANSSTKALSLFNT